MYYDLKKTGKRISELRKHRGYTQMQFAEKLNISRGFYGKVETGVKAPSVDLLLEISEITGVTIDYLVTGRQRPMDRVKLVLREVIKMLERLEMEL